MQLPGCSAEQESGVPGGWWHPWGPVAGGLAPGQLVGGDTSLFVLEAECCVGALRAGTEVWGARGTLNALGCQPLAWPALRWGWLVPAVPWGLSGGAFKAPSPVLGELLGSEQLCKPIKSSASLTPRGSCSGDLH